MLVEEIEPNLYYCVKSTASGYYIGFQIYTTEVKNKECYYTTEFIFNEKSYWLCVDYLETTSPS